MRGVLLGTLMGALLGTTIAMSWTVVAHTAALWYHGMNAEDATGDGHPFLDSTDGHARSASAAYYVCFGGPHSPDGQYIHTHVHRYSDRSYIDMEAHIFSTQTGLLHHAHHPC
jgi:hypothetical protein